LTKDSKYLSSLRAETPDKNRKSSLFAMLKLLPGQLNMPMWICRKIYIPKYINDIEKPIVHITKSFKKQN
jgi:hypothetical protein